MIEQLREQVVGDLLAQGSVAPNDGRGVRSAVAARSAIPAYFGV